MRAPIVALVATLSLPACGFFSELEDADSVDTESGSGTAGSSDGQGSGTGELVEGAPCELLADDRCHDQDLLASCSPEDGVLRVVDCAQMCGIYTNFSCVGTGTGQHACWCVEPGVQAVNSCAELEVCLSQCGDFGACADACFAKSTQTTIRLYGALVHCAESYCDETCREDPAGCPACVVTARVEGSGDCTIPRALCDGDENDEPSWP